MTLELPRNSCQYDFCADTFRRKSRQFFKKTIFECGSNMQNPTKHICQIYVADKGKCLLQGDQAGAEALVVAYEVRAGNFRDLFINKIKSHVYVALHLFAEKWQELHRDINITELVNTPISKLKEKIEFTEVEKSIKLSDTWQPSKRYYFMAKQVCHSSNYGIKAPTLRMNVLQKSDGRVALTSAQAEYFHTTYTVKLFPEIAEWHGVIRTQLKLTRTLRNLYGFPRVFNGMWNDKMLKEAYAFIPQSTVGIITMNAFTRLQEYIESEHLNWDVLNDKHDSVMIQVPDNNDDIVHACAKMREFINVPLVGSADGTKYNMRSEIQKGYNWATASDDNPNGMKEIKL